MAPRGTSCPHSSGVDHHSTTCCTWASQISGRSHLSWSHGTKDLPQPSCLHPLWPVGSHSCRPPLRAPSSLNSGPRGLLHRDTHPVSSELSIHPSSPLPLHGYFCPCHQWAGAYARLWAWWDPGQYSSASPSVCGDTDGAHHCCYYWPVGLSPQEAVLHLLWAAFLRAEA